MIIRLREEQDRLKHFGRVRAAYSCRRQPHLLDGGGELPEREELRNVLHDLLDDLTVNADFPEFAYEKRALVRAVRRDARAAEFRGKGIDVDLKVRSDRAGSENDG